MNILIALLIKIGIVPFIRFLKITELENTITAGSFQIVETEQLVQDSTDYFIVAKRL